MGSPRAPTLSPQLLPPPPKVRSRVYSPNSSVLTNRLRKKIASSLGRSSLGLVDMKPIRPINIPLTAWGTKGLMLPGSNWAGVPGLGAQGLKDEKQSLIGNSPASWPNSICACPLTLAEATLYLVGGGTRPASLHSSLLHLIAPDGRLGGCLAQKKVWTQIHPLDRESPVSFIHPCPNPFLVQFLSSCSGKKVLSPVIRGPVLQKFFGEARILEAPEPDSSGVL